MAIKRNAEDNFAVASMAKIEPNVAAVLRAHQFNHMSITWVKNDIGLVHKSANRIDS